MHTIANAINKTQDLNIIDKLKSCNRIKTTIKFNKTKKWKFNKTVLFQNLKNKKRNNFN